MLGQRWAVVASCDHPEWPVVALPAQAAKTREESFHAALVVHAGDIVRLWKQEEFLRIETAGVAEENGYPGKTIRVRLLHRSTDDPLVQQQLAGIVRGTGGCGDAAMRQLIQSGTRVRMCPWSADGSMQIILIPAAPPPEDPGSNRVAVGIAITLLLLLAVSSLHAQVETIKKALAPKPNIAATSLTSYLERVRAENSNIQPTPGAIWTDSGRLTRMTTDVRAMRPHDLIQVVVAETLRPRWTGR